MMLSMLILQVVITFLFGAMAEIRLTIRKRRYPVLGSGVRHHSRSPLARRLSRKSATRQTMMTYNEAIAREQRFIKIYKYNTPEEQRRYSPAHLAETKKTDV